MQSSIFSRRLPNAIVVGLIALALLATSLSFQHVSASSGSLSPNSVHISPVYDYAGKAEDTTFSCQSNTSASKCYGPKQIQNAYSFTPLYNKGITGKGRSIAIIDAFSAPDIQSDLQSFNQTFGVASAPFNIYQPDGVPAFDPNDLNQVNWSGEITLDVEWSHAVAPGATINLIEAKSNNDDDLISALNYAVKNNLGDVISMSFGGNETCIDSTEYKAWHNAFFSATLKGITLFASAGDSGAAQGTCDGNSYTKAVSSPANDPLVTSVGGTTLDADAVTGAYNGETVWNEPDVDVATGGGFSTVVRKPWYQALTPGIGKYRGEPDVAYNASVDHGVLTVWSESGLGAGLVFRFGGTSAGSPQWAGITALADQYGNKRVGFINPIVYILGDLKPTASAVYHDVTSGNNSITLSDIDGNPVSIQGYSASKGWDPTTGFGSPVVSKFVPLLSALSISNKGQIDSNLPSLK